MSLSWWSTGYSVAIATVLKGRVYFAGAPRHKHIGAVFGFTQNTHHWSVTHTVHGIQVLCVCVELFACGCNSVLFRGIMWYHIILLSLYVSSACVFSAGVVFWSRAVCVVWWWHCLVSSWGTNVLRCRSWRRSPNLLCDDRSKTAINPNMHMMYSNFWSWVYFLVR